MCVSQNTSNSLFKHSLLPQVLEPLQVSEVEQQEGSTPQAPLPAPGPVPLSALDLTSDDLYDTSAEPAAAPVPRVATDADLDLATEVRTRAEMVCVSSHGLAGTNVCVKPSHV